MNSILGIGLSGLKSYLQKLSSTANNAANVNTRGYKSVRVESEEAVSGAAGRSAGVRTAGISRNHAAGTPIETGNPLDMAINGEGFFVLTGANGTRRYTRNGSFQRSANGGIVSSGGLRLGEGIEIPENAESVSISRDGRVLAHAAGEAETVHIGQIGLARFPNPQGLRPAGDGSLGQTEASGNPQPGIPGNAGFGEVVQGFLESSNVDLIDTQTNLISQQHAFQANANSVRAADNNLGTAINIKR